MSDTGDTNLSVYIPVRVSQTDARVLDWLAKRYDTGTRQKVGRSAVIRHLIGHHHQAYNKAHRPNDVTTGNDATEEGTP